MLHGRVLHDTSRCLLLLSGFFPFADAAQGILLLALLLLVVRSDALLNVALELAAKTDGQLGQFEGHLIVLIFLCE